MLKDNLNSLRREIVQTSYDTGEGHIASSFSILNILNVLYCNILNLTPENLNSVDRNIFVMSKGHASIGLYAILAKYRLIEKKELNRFGSYGSILGGHPDRNKIPAVEVSTGSLGHGLPIAVGMAFAKKIKNESGRVYTLVGDGELNEGSMWESLLLANEHLLDNFCCIVDYNHSTDRALNIGDLKSKFLSFGFNVAEIDGHNEVEIKKQLLMQQNLPQAIIAHTIKGFGCKRMEDNPEWHHKSPNQEELKEIMEELQ